jgi:hypothetical protein
MIARLSPRLKPMAARPHANARTSAATWLQFHDCQMPSIFFANAGVLSAQPGVFQEKLGERIRRAGVARRWWDQAEAR